MSRHSTVQKFVRPNVVFRLFGLLGGIWLICSGSAIHSIANGQEPKLDQVKFIFSVHCIECHNALEKKGGLDLSTNESMLLGGDSGVVLVPGKESESLMWNRITSDEMPPKKPLGQSERETIRSWIANNAPWPGGKLDAAEFTSETRAGYDWWSLQPILAISPPSTTELNANPIDGFVMAKLNASGMTPSPPADRRTLARRIAFDLTGLPPAQGSVQKLIESENPNALEHWIDSLLDSPAYGQRWARHWLDTIRFGESHGFERDQLRTNSWRYRDWVVKAFNQDMPYDEFCRMQIAGDALLPNTLDGIIATGMLVAGSYDQVGQTQQSKAMREVVRQDELEDVVSLVSQTFLGLTVNCSRCHDHKFDPIPQREYYQMCAALAGAHHGEPKLKPELLANSARPITVRLEARQTELKRLITEIEQPVKDRIIAERAVTKSTQEAPVPISRWEFDDPRDSIGGLDVELRSNAVLQDGRLILKDGGYASSKNLNKTLKEKTLEVWVQLANTTQRGGAAISVESLKGNVFDAIVYGEVEPNRWMAGSDGFTRTESFQAEEMESTSSDLVHVAIVYEADGTIRAYRNGLPYGHSIRKSNLIEFPLNTTHVLFGLRHSPAGDGKMLNGALERAQLYDRALTDEEVRTSANVQTTFVSNSELTTALDLPAKELLAEYRFELNQIREQLQRVSDSRVYAIASKEPSKTFLLARGNPGSPLDSVLPGGVSAVKGIAPDFLLDDTANDGQRRLKLAQWITEKRNPLFARVIVNRVWQYHFGAGIVETPNDFGFNGGRPSHPELLDWLANDLIEHGWSLKHLHRRILSSKTYQQSSQIVPSNMEKDAGNRLLWRKSPSRLDAESLRDTMLDLAGQLEPSLDGPGYYDFSLSINNSHFYSMRQPSGESFQRRTLYRTVVRSARSNLLDVFDCPDPSTKSPLRASTTTPLQSLSLMNNALVIRLSEAWAKRASLSSGETLPSQVVFLFEQAYFRKPDASELTACVELADKHGLASVCRVLLNSNELLYVD